MHEAEDDEYKPRSLVFADGVEPCPFCGNRLALRDYASFRMYVCWTSGCTYQVPGEKLDQHERYCRILRKAQDYVESREAIPKDLYLRYGDDTTARLAYEDLRDAVLGEKAQEE